MFQATTALAMRLPEGRLALQRNHIIGPAPTKRKQKRTPKSHRARRPDAQATSQIRATSERSPAARARRARRLPRLARTLAGDGLRILPLVVHPEPIGRARANLLLELSRVALDHL